MARNTDGELGATVFRDLAPRFCRELKFGGVVSPHRLVAIATDGDLEHAAFNSTKVVGASTGEKSRTADGDLVEHVGGIAWGPCVVEVDTAVNEGERLKAAQAGRAIPLVDSNLAGSTIKTTGAGIAFTNQPANDGVEVVSSNAADTTQSVTIIGTTQGTDTVVVETVTLNGVAVVATTKVDWGLILAVKLSASCAGTVTVQEASGNLAITTLLTTVLSKGVETVAAADQRAFNQEPTAVADGATTKQIGLQGTDEDGTVIYDSQALNGATAVTMNDTFRTVTEVYTGDLEAARTATIAVGAEESALLGVGKTLEAAAAQGDLVNALILPL